MLLTDLQFPVTIVAPDGWAQYTKTADHIRDWGLHGVRKYSRIGFIAADAKGSVWRMTRIEPERKVRIWERFRLMPVRVPTKITMEAIEGDPLAIFREHLTRSLEKDDDSLTQFHSQEKIKGVLSSAASLPKLLTTLHRMHVT